MKTLGSFFQVVGLAAIVVGASLEYGLAGAVASCGAVAVFLGLAFERET